MPQVLLSVAPVTIPLCGDLGSPKNILRLEGKPHKARGNLDLFTTASPLPSTQ